MGNRTPQIAIAPVGLLDPASEVELLRAALEREPENKLVLARLTELLLELDQFDGLIALLAPKLSDLDFGLCMALAKACLYTRTSDLAKAELALKAIEAAIARADSHAMRASALAERGKAQQELGSEAAAEADLRGAFKLDPAGPLPLKRMVLLLVRQRGFTELEAVTAQLIADGFVRTDVLAARVLALAGLGEATAARELAAFDQFGLEERIELPVGWPTLAAFNQVIPGLRFERFATASRQTWRVDSPARGNTPAIDALLDAITVQAARWIDALPQVGHPWLTARPAALMLKCWCVIAGGEGFERWHFHPEGWMSGGYYVEVPPAVVGGNDASGCFAFGLPERDVGETAASQFGEKLVRPYPGLLSLFPSQAQHSTHRHGIAAQRMCLAFDLCPA
jgi:tetratricopeptide (TPR) repeat protein